MRALWHTNSKGWLMSGAGLRRMAFLLLVALVLYVAFRVGL